MTLTFKVSPGVNRARKKQFQRPVLIRAKYKSRLEDRVAGQLEAEGLPFDYEKEAIHYTVPSRKTRYTPDFFLPNGIILETKGWFQAKDRVTLRLVKEQHPDLDIRVVFDGKATRQKLTKKSPTTYAKWCDDHGFQWADGGQVPTDWIAEARK